MTRLSSLDRLISVVAALACLVLALGLVDTPVRAVSTEQQPLLPRGTLQDAELGVLARDVAGKPLANVTLTVFYQRDKEYFWAGKGRTDASGRAHFRRLPRGVVWLLADKEGFARTSTELVLTETPREAQVELGPAHALTVSVQDESGRALEEATVLVEDEDRLPHGELTDRSGKARLTRLARAPWRVRVSARGYETRRLETQEDVEVRLRKLGALSVHVVDASGNPVSGATVVVSGARLWPARRTTTLATGVATITGLLAGSYDLSAYKGRQVSPTVYGFTLADGAQDELTLRLQPGRMVEVLVVDGERADAAPVEAADVVLVEGGLSSFPRRGRTDREGRVVLGPIALGPAMLAARAQGFVSRSGVPVPDDLEAKVRIALSRGATLEGEVVDREGRPVVGASIEVVGSDRFGFPISESPLLMNFSRMHFAWALAGPVSMIPAGELGVMPGPVPPIPGLGSDGVESGGMLAFQGQEPEPIEPWVTRGNGEFSLHPVTPGRVHALVRHPDFVENFSEAVTLEPGGRAKVRVELFRGGTLEGRVNDARGFPVSGVTVELRALRGTYERYAITAHDGRFVFAAVPSQVVISVSRTGDTGRSALREHLEVTEGGRTEIELTLPEPRADVEVFVMGERDTPIGMAQVSVTSLDPSVPLRETYFTGDDGRVSVAELAGLPALVSVEAAGYAPRRVELKQVSDSITVRLEAGVGVTGRVTAVRGRFPVAHARVTLLSAGERRLTTTDERGTYRFEHVPVGNARISVEHPEHASAELQVLVTETGRADRPFEVDPIDLAEPGSVSGTVLDASGKPVQGARVAVGFVPAYLPLGSLPSGLTVTDAEGHFELEGLSPGRVELGAYAPGVGRGRTGGVVVDSGRSTTGVVLHLDQAIENDLPVAQGHLAVTLGERGAGTGLEVVVVDVAGASEAERAGLQIGDRLLTIDGRAPRNMPEARLLLSGPVGSHVVLTIDRGGQQRTLSVVREEVRR